MNLSPLSKDEPLVERLSHEGVREAIPNVSVVSVNNIEDVMLLLQILQYLHQLVRLQNVAERIDYLQTLQIEDVFHHTRYL